MPSPCIPKQPQRQVLKTRVFAFLQMHPLEKNSSERWGNQAGHLGHVDPWREVSSKDTIALWE